MAHGEQVLLIVSNNGTKKRDLVARLEELLLEFKNQAINGSIQLHFSEGYLAKVHSTKVD